MDRAHLLALSVSAALVCAAALGIRAVGLFVGPELVVYDLLLRDAARASPNGDSPIVIVQITEADIREQKHWPISDRTLTDAMTGLQAAGASVIGLDLYRDLGVPPGEEAFQHLLSGSSSIITVRKFGDPTKRGIPGPPALAGSRRVGFNDIIFDSDETVRRGLLYQDDGTHEVEYAFALLVALKAAGIALAPDPVHPEWLRLGPTTLPALGADDGGYVGVDAAGYQFLIDFAAAESRFPTWSLGQLLRGEIGADAIRDKVVLIGSNANSVPDLVEIPQGGRIPGVELHAHMIGQLIRYARGRSLALRTVNDWQEVGLVLVAGILGSALVLAGRGGALRGALTLVVIVSGGMLLLAAASLFAFRAGWWVPVVAPGVAWVGGSGLATAWLSSRERAQRAELMGLFARHLSPEVAEEIWQRRKEFLREGRPRPRHLEVTVLFVDMKGYSAQAKVMNPGQLMEWLNEFLGRMAHQVELHGGVIEDYFGDGFKANFGFPLPRTETPEVAADACAAIDSALAMAEALEVLNSDYAARGLPRVAMRIGVDSGSAVAGSIGSEDHLKYSAVGDVVVTAQRLEATAAVEHDFGARPSRILISGPTLDLLEGRYETEPVGSVRLKGLDGGVSAHRVLGSFERV